MSATPLDAIQSYVDAFNAGDADGMSAMFSVNGSILDGMAPVSYTHLTLPTTF